MLMTQRDCGFSISEGFGDYIPLFSVLIESETELRRNFHLCVWNQILRDEVEESGIFLKDHVKQTH